MGGSFRALDLDWTYMAFDVGEDELPAALGGVRALGIEGLSVTMPHKEAVTRLVDRVSPTAELLGAVNTVVRRGRLLMADSTDGAGFLDALRMDLGFDPAGCRCLVIGSGGTARAVILALAGAGARQVTIAGRTAERVRRAAELAGPMGKVGAVEEADEAELVVNATPVGMVGQPPGPPVEASRLGPGQVVLDVVYHPAVTPLVAAARRQGANAVGGLGMLVHQAAHAFRLWTGQDPPLEVMSGAAVGALSHEAMAAPVTGPAVQAEGERAHLPES
jgi:shikimate dehydrogenase